MILSERAPMERIQETRYHRPVIRVTAIIRPHKLEAVKTAISALGVSGMTVSDVRGAGAGPEGTALLGIGSIAVSLSLKSKVEVAVPAEMKEAMIEAISAAAHTGDPGDGKIFIEPISDILRVRTKERGEAALGMERLNSEG